MLPVFRWFSAIFFILGTLLTSFSTAQAVSGNANDPYVLRYLKASEPISLPLDGQGQFRTFTSEDLSVGKRLFEENCKNCHVGGATLPNPLVSLSMEDLKGAIPPRNTIQGLVAYQREPRAYDGQDFGFGCREVAESWMPTEELQKLAAFVLRAAEVAPGWGVDRFS
jgi:photosystem II cytochrome c550